MIKNQALWIAISFLMVSLAEADTVGVKNSRVLFFISKTTDIYTGVVELVKRDLHSQNGSSYEFSTVVGDSFVSTQSTFNPDLVVAVGSSASKMAMKEKLGLPLLTVLITDSAFNTLANKYYGSKAAAHASNVSVICLDQPFQRSVKLAKLLVPDAEVAGIMIGPSSKHMADGFSEYVKSENMIPTLVDIELEDNPIHKLEPIIRYSDVFIPVPDNRLVNIATARWILQLSYRYKTPVIAYSKTYLDAGALAAIFSSIENVAKQTSEFIADNNISNGGGAHVPAYYSIEFNHSVAGNLGIELNTEQFYRNALKAK